MRRRLFGRRVLITGAASGIGRALAIEAAQEGMKLILNDVEVHNIELVATEVRRCSAQVIVSPGDVTMPSAREAMFAAAQAAFGGLDILVNNAGIGSQGHFVDLPAENLRQVL